MASSDHVMVRQAARLAGLALVCGPAMAAGDGAPSADGVDAMALYAQGSAVVQDQRKLDLKQGAQTINWPAPGVVNAETLWLSGDGVRLNGFQVKQNQSNGNGILASHVGEKVSLTSPDGSQSDDGVLVALEGDIAYVRVGGQIRRITPASPTQVSWSGGVNTDGAQTPSSLRLNVEADKAGEQSVTATYQMEAPSWQASYTGRFNDNNGQLDLQANAVIDNSNHAALNAQKAWLVAGDVSRAGNNYGPQPVAMMARAQSKVAGDAAGAPESSGSVYRYPLQQGLHVPANVTKAISLMKPVQFKAEQHYSFDHYALSDNGDTRNHASVELSFKNSSDVPLPGGAVRIYSAGDDAELMGGGQIDDTPTGAPAKLSLGEAFDITGTHQVVGQSETGKSPETRTVKVVLYNASDKTRSVSVSERLPNGATLAKNAPKTSGGSASEPQWEVKVPAGGKQSLSYTLQMPARQ